MSLDSVRDVEGSVDGGEKMVPAAGVLGGKESRWISAVGTGSDVSCERTSGRMVRVTVERERPDFFLSGFSGFSGFSGAEDRCFFGERTGSVLTGSGNELASYSVYEQCILTARKDRSVKSHRFVLVCIPRIIGSLRSPPTELERFCLRLGTIVVFLHTELPLRSRPDGLFW